MNSSGSGKTRLAIEAAHRAGFGAIKVNMVVKRGVNDDQIVPMARHFRRTRPTLLGA